MNRRGVAVILLALGAMVLGACGGYSAPAPAATQPAAQGAQGEVVVAASYAKFQPLSLAVVQGQPIILKVSSSDTSHTFTIDELGINIPVGMGQTITETITVDKPGKYTFYCSVPGHRSAGMEGTLEVK